MTTHDDKAMARLIRALDRVHVNRYEDVDGNALTVTTTERGAIFEQGGMRVYLDDHEVMTLMRQIAMSVAYREEEMA